MPSRSFIGPPKPRTRFTSDEHGELIIFNGKLCNTCRVLLTSRNRYGHYLFCTEHGRDRDRDRNRKRGTSPKPRKPKAQTRTGEFSEHPQREALHQVLSLWINSPTEESRRRDLQSALVDYELRARLSDLLPQGTTLSAYLLQQQALTTITTQESKS
jgi:hypothetical protein